MSASVWVRQVHRWLALAFTVGVIVNFAVLGQETYPVWAGIMALAPLALLECTGLYLFVQPYLARRRGAQRAS